MSYLDTLEQVQVEEVVAPPVKKKRGRPRIYADRDEVICRSYFENGASVKEISAAYMLSVASVYNILRKGKQQQ